MRTVNTFVLALVGSLLLVTMPAFGQSGKPASGAKESAQASGKRTTAVQQAPVNTRDPSRFTYLRLYCTPDGNSHFQSATGDLRKTDFAPPAAPLYIGDKFPAASAFFGGFDAGWGANDVKTRLYHPAPAAQFIIVLGGVFSITATDGETRRFRPGDVLRLEDTPPCKGHITVVGDKPGFFMFVR